MYPCIRYKITYSSFHLSIVWTTLLYTGYFTNLLIRYPNTTWEQFRLKLINRFSGTKYRNAHEALGLLFQEGGVEDYIEDFEELSALILDQ